MFHVITGGSGSGKSAYAEEEIVKLGDAPRIYIATMYPFDEESHYRIARHRRMRAEKKFVTVECYTNLASVQVPLKANVLLECMSNLTANEMFQSEGAGIHTVPAVMEGIRTLLSQCNNLLVVTNEIFSDGIQYDEETINYQRYLADINIQMAAKADCMTEVVYGIPLKMK